MVLTRFFKPKWQHQDPAVRQQAVAALTPDDTDILVQVAREDDAPAVRRLALERLDDLELLHSVAVEDSDTDIRAFAFTCLSALLAGTRNHSPRLDARMEFLSRHPDTKLLEFLAMNAVEAELRRQAQDRITREALLQDIAVGDAVLANREAALERITDPERLEAINRQTSKRDKQIYRQSRLRLDAIREAQERPARIRAEAERICSTLEAMVPGSDLQAQQNELQRLQARWQAIGNEADPDVQVHYARALDAFLEAATAFRAAREAEAQQWAVIAAGREALLAQMEQRLAALRDMQALTLEDESGIAAELNAWQRAWQETGELPVAQAQSLDDQFTQHSGAIRQRLEALQQHRQMEQVLQSLLDEAEQMSGSQQPVAEAAVKDLEKRGKQPHWPADSEPLAADLQRFEALCRQLRKRLRHQLEQRRTGLERLPGMLTELESLLQQQTLKEAVPLHDRIHSSIKLLQALGVDKGQLGGATRKLYSLTPKLMELRSWCAWSTDEARQRLCEEMESLVGREMKPAALAGEIRRLRSEWKQLPASGAAGFRSLHKRFDKAAREAYKPCEVFFQQQGEERARNLEQKQALLQRLEAFLSSAEWSHMDWPAAVKFQRQLGNDWRQAGPVDRRKSREIESRYKGAMETLNEYLSTERQRNVSARKALIESVRELHNSEDINKAIEECKRLQTRWQVTVPARRQQENRLWQEFRAASDDVFSRRRQQQAARHETEKQNRVSRLQLCEQLEGLAHATLDELDDAVRQQHRILDAWKASGPVAKRDAPGLDKRFEAAQHGFQARVEALRAQLAQALLQQLRQKAGCCSELEQLLEQTDPEAIRTRLASLESQWTGLPPLNDAAAEQTMQARYARAREALLAGAEQRDRLLGELCANLDTRRELCLRMEILAGVESPPEAQQARMELQVKRLAEAMGHGAGDTIDTMAEIQHAWYMKGAAPAAEQQALQQRFEQASRTASQKGT